MNFFDVIRECTNWRNRNAGMVNPEAPGDFLFKYFVSKHIQWSLAIARIVITHVLG